MDRNDLTKLLEEVRTGGVDVETAVRRLSGVPYVDLEHAKVDTHRELRCGFSEVVFGAGKTPEELARISATVALAHGRLLATRVDAPSAASVLEALPEAEHHPRAGCVTLGLPDPGSGLGDVLVVSAGTSDAPVACEAELTARMLGARTELLVDVGVAGIHRLLAHGERLRDARVLVVVAGMEGALPSVVGGLVEVPLIAVPTSVGYGASFDGLAALLAMLNSCAAGVTVVNIDNGFGAGYAAATINRLAERSHALQ